MAGNIVKWWKHKILGGYKQFSGKKCILLIVGGVFLLLLDEIVQ